MSDTSEKTSGTRRRSGTIGPDYTEAPTSDTATVITESSVGPRIIISSASPTLPFSHFGTPHDSKHHEKEDPKVAAEESGKVARDTDATKRSEKGKILTDAEEKQAVDEAYKAVMEEEYTPPSR
ncbi:hypothetical protein MMC18_003394 [Xylographa bjoerkii]|nr:hypothetical protein [Xylographa bjoerkii]